MDDCPLKTYLCSKENCDNCSFKIHGICNGCPYYYAIWEHKDTSVISAEGVI
jgi:hypothetical protein